FVKFLSGFTGDLFDCQRRCKRHIGGCQCDSLRSGGGTAAMYPYLVITRRKVVELPCPRAAKGYQVQIGIVPCHPQCGSSTTTRSCGNGYMHHSILHTDTIDRRSGESADTAL